MVLSNWTYTASFVLTGTHLRHRIVLLDLHGVDTFAQVRLNGHQVGTLDNMFVKYTFQVWPLPGKLTTLTFLPPSQIQPYLRLGRNELSFRFTNAIHVGEREAARFPYPVPVTKNLYDLPNRNFVRKAQSDFGYASTHIHTCAVLGGRDCVMVLLLRCVDRIAGGIGVLALLPWGYGGRCTPWGSARGGSSTW